MTDVLALGVDSERFSEIEAFAAPFGLTLKRVAPAEYNRTLGGLFGLPGFEERAPVCLGQMVSNEILVFRKRDDIMDALLDAWKRSPLAPVAIKAVLTPTNCEWTPLALSAELEKEHAYWQNRKN